MAPTYVIVTPAHNEEAFIGLTLASMIAQTIQPLRWVIVNDGSTDRTAEIVAGYAARYPFIELVDVTRGGDRNFGNKVRAFDRGLARCGDCARDFVGNIDADISFEPDYFEKILATFATNPQLGIAGGSVASKNGDRYISQDVAEDSVAGAVQLFRRACFEQIGGYRALPGGGCDAAAEIMARMHGWRVRTVASAGVLEHRRTGTATARPLVARWREGRRFRSLGYGLLFFGLRCMYRSKERPRVIGGIAALLGYVHATAQRCPVVLPDDAVRFLRAEQKTKLRRQLRAILH